MNSVIGLIDVDGHNFPNLALMRISAWHKAHGDHVEWWQTGFKHYDKVYMSKIFSDAYSQEPWDLYIDADEIVRGGTGYAISLSDGREVYDKRLDGELPEDVERMFPDYSIYPQYDFAVSMTSRGCPRGCDFCHVAEKEGRCSKKVADVRDFWDGSRNVIEVLDPNITACRDKRELMKAYRETGAYIIFSQGLDIRLIDDDDIWDLQHTKLKELHFAWDRPEEDLEEKFRWFKEKYGKNTSHGSVASVYVLVNNGSGINEDLHRIYVLRDLGYDPYVMVYDKPHADKNIRRLQRWVNNKVIFKSVERFEDYKQENNSTIHYPGRTED